MLTSDGREQSPKLDIRSFSAGGLFRLGCLGSGTFWLLNGLLFGLLALFGRPTVRINGSQLYGPIGFAGGVALGLLFAGVASLGFLIGTLIVRHIPKLKEIEIWTKDLEKLGQEAGD